MTADRITIPPEVVEAAAKAFIERRVDAAVWTHLSEESKRGYQDEARAAITAALAAWPSAWTEDARLLGAGAGPCLILPLPQENSNDR